jgi:hypothetical protein
MTSKESAADKTAYRYRVGFNQSLSTGIIAFEGVIQFDESEAKFRDAYNVHLCTLLKDAEIAFKEFGYRVASDIEPKIKNELKEVIFK